MGPVGKLMGMIPGMDKLLQLSDGKADPSKKLKTYMVIMDSMTSKG
jgi:signal recognition particle GTPase